MLFSALETWDMVRNRFKRTRSTAGAERKQRNALLGRVLYATGTHHAYVAVLKQQHKRKDMPQIVAKLKNYAHRMKVYIIYYIFVVFGFFSVLKDIQCKKKEIWLK